MLASSGEGSITEGAAGAAQQYSKGEKISKGEIANLKKQIPQEVA